MSCDRETEPADGHVAPAGATLESEIEPLARVVGPVAERRMSPPSSDPGSRPILDWERPWLVRLGAEVRELRLSSGLSQADLAAVSGMAERSLRRIEYGERRTRLSTLDRLVQGLTMPAANGLGRDEILSRLLAAAGPVIAPESAYAGRVDARRRRRRTKASRRFITQHTVTFKEVREGVLETHHHRSRVGRTRTRDRAYQVLQEPSGRRRRVRARRSQPDPTSVLSTVADPDTALVEPMENLELLGSERGVSIVVRGPRAEPRNHRGDNVGCS